MEKKLNQIFLNRTGIQFKNRVDLWNKHFFGTCINLEERDAVYILLDIQREFDVVIPKQKIIEKQFISYASIKKMLAELIASEDDNHKNTWEGGESL